MASSMRAMRDTRRCSSSTSALHAPASAHRHTAHALSTRSLAYAAPAWQCWPRGRRPWASETCQMA
jgi:hypothetical protein